jgi:catechol 2,3-dioxygenase-like lactoylglutathione lyase family enzyme
MTPHHIGYVVEDLPAAVERWTRELGAGPFRTLAHIEFDEVTFEGAPAVYDHSSAFGAWGPVLVELTQVHEARPPGISRPPGLGHVGFLAEDLEREVARLQHLGLRVFHTGRTGPVHAVWLAGGPFGHPVEVLQQVPELLGFYASLRV